MSSSSIPDGGNAAQEANVESIVGNNDVTNLETDIKSFQVNETHNEAQRSTAEEGIAVRKSHNRNMNSSTELSSEQNTGKHPVGIIRETQPKTTHWRCPGSHHPRGTKEYTSVSQSSSWRDPNFKYERESSSRNRKNDCSNNSQDSFFHRDGKNHTEEIISSSFGDTQAYLPIVKNRDRSKMGNWTFTCASNIILDNGLTEVEHVRNCVKELYEQNGELFATQRPSEFGTSRGGIKINCYTFNYEDKAQVAKIADILMAKIKTYPYCFYYFYDKKPMYMRTCERELYECSETSWKLVNFNE